MPAPCLWAACRSEASTSLSLWIELTCIIRRSSQLEDSRTGLREIWCKNAGLMAASTVPREYLNRNSLKTALLTAIKDVVSSRGRDADGAACSWRERSVAAGRHE